MPAVEALHPHEDVALAAHLNREQQHSAALTRIDWWRRHENAMIWSFVSVCALAAYVVTGVIGHKNYSPTLLSIVGVWVASEMSWLIAMFWVDLQTQKLTDKLLP